MLARGARRQREMSVRLALGAGRATHPASDARREPAARDDRRRSRDWRSRTSDEAPSRSSRRTSTGRSSGLPRLITIVTGLLFGFAPAFAALRTEIADSVKRQPRRWTSPWSDSRSRWRRFWSSRAGLFIRSLAGLHRRQSWIPHRSSAARADRPAAESLPRRRERRVPSAHGAGDRRAFPASHSVAGAEAPYLSGRTAARRHFLRQGEALDASRTRPSPTMPSAVDFFETLGIPIARRTAVRRQTTPATSPKVAVINQRLAATRFPHAESDRQAEFRSAYALAMATS